MRTPSPAVREAGPADAEPLAKLAEKTFRATYGHLNARENLEAHCAASFGEVIQGREIADPGIVTLLAIDPAAENPGALAGYGQLRWSPAPSCVEAARPAEIHRLYVDRPWHGKGVAQGLMASLLDRARRDGADSVWLGVWERNPRAIAFYTKCGFAEVGEHVFAVGEDHQRDLVLARRPALRPGLTRSLVRTRRNPTR